MLALVLIEVPCTTVIENRHGTKPSSRTAGGDGGQQRANMASCGNHYVAADAGPAIHKGIRTRHCYSSALDNISVFIARGTARQESPKLPSSGRVRRARSSRAVPAPPASVQRQQVHRQAETGMCPCRRVRTSHTDDASLHAPPGSIAASKRARQYDTPDTARSPRHLPFQSRNRPPIQLGVYGRHRQPLNYTTRYADGSRSRSGHGGRRRHDRRSRPAHEVNLLTGPLCRRSELAPPSES